MTKKEKKLVMDLLINNQTKEEIEIFNDLEQVIEEVLHFEKIDKEKCEISLSFVDSLTIHNLNKEYRNVDRITDVLSFPIEDFYNEERDTILKKEHIMLGDIIICVDVAKRQAKELGHSFKREIMYLTCHSMLHLLGYDHMNEEDKKLMRSREKEIMKNLGVFK